jgi:hypothetical protein
VGRRHTAQKRYGVRPTGELRTSYSCNADGCDWRSDPDLTDRAQREQHRQHRRDNGEEVKGQLKLDQNERVKALRLVHASDRPDEPTTGSCTFCDVPWPCLHWHVLDGDRTATEELMKQVEVHHELDQRLP